jgi:hypothetical protein
MSAGPRATRSATSATSEALTQDRLRSGTRDVDAADVTGEDTIERRTRNLNVFADIGTGARTGPRALVL